MQHPTAFRLMLAASLSFGILAGCQTPTTPVTTAEQRQSATRSGQHAALAMAEDREMEYYGFIADEAAAPAGYAVMATASASPSPSPSSSASASPSPSASTSPSPAASATPRPVSTPRALPSLAPRVAPTPRTGTTTTGSAPAKAFFTGKLPAEVKAKIDERHARVRAQAKAKTDSMTAEKEAIGKATRTARWVKNSDGTETQSLAFTFEKSVNGQTFSRVVKMTRIRKSDDKTLVSAHTEFTNTHGDVTRKVVRDKTLNEDGSYQVVFHSEMTFKDGTKRTADWTKTIAADGSVTGTGTIVWTGKTNKAINVTFGGTEGAEVAKSPDAGSQTETVVTMTPEGQAKAEVKSPAGATAEVPVQSEVDAIDTAAQP